MADHTDQPSIRDCRIRLMRGGTGAPLLFLHGGGGRWLPRHGEAREGPT